MDGGAVHGYDLDTGETYGAHGLPLPPGALSAFVMSEGEWQMAKRRRKPAGRTSDGDDSDDSEDARLYWRSTYRGFDGW